MNDMIRSLSRLRADTRLGLLIIIAGFIPGAVFWGIAIYNRMGWTP